MEAVDEVRLEVDGDPNERHRGGYWESSVNLFLGHRFRMDCEDGEYIAAIAKHGGAIVVAAYEAEQIRRDDEL